MLYFCQDLISVDITLPSLLPQTKKGTTANACSKTFLPQPQFELGRTLDATMETVVAPYQALTTALTSCNDLTITCLVTILPSSAVCSAKVGTDNITDIGTIHFNILCTAMAGHNITVIEPL